MRREVGSIIHGPIQLCRLLGTGILVSGYAEQSCWALGLAAMPDCQLTGETNVFPLHFDSRTVTVGPIRGTSTWSGMVHVDCIHISSGVSDETRDLALSMQRKFMLLPIVRRTVTLPLHCLPKPLASYTKVTPSTQPDPDGMSQ